MQKMRKLLDSIEKMEHEACKDCPWGVRGMAFGISCKKHHYDLDSNKGAAIISIGQDPGGTTPERTGTLCAFCNSDNATDRTAINALELMKTAVIGVQNLNSDQTHPLFKQWYVTNALKHGVPTHGLSADSMSTLKNAKNEARRCCSRVLKDEIDILKPKCIKASGSDALFSLKDIGLVTQEFGAFKNYVMNSPITVKNYYPDGSGVTVFCVFHTGAQSTNRNASKLYNDSVLEKIELLKRNHPSPGLIDGFIKKYSNGSDTVRKGMMIHLLSWLKFGEVARKVVV